MNRVFADTGYYVAITNSRDQFHAVAIEFLGTYSGEIITTEFVLVEVANFLSRSHAQRQAFLKLDAELRISEEVIILPVTTDLYARGRDLFAARPDKEWSLTDCISFEVMTELELTDALTADQYFEQAGFRPLLKPEAAS